MEQRFYKVTDLFGNEETFILTKKREKENLFEEYDKFLEKFKPKLTTDDCYTPTGVMDIIFEYVNERGCSAHIFSIQFIWRH